MKIAVIGAGPAGLYFSLLAKKNNPAHEIDVYEQNPEGATYGWGVVFSDVGLAFLKEADAEFFAEFTAHHEQCDYMEVVHRGTHVQMHGNHFSRIARIDMLNTLQRACTRVGVRIHFGRRIEEVAALASSVDLVIAADGGNSAVRTQLAAHFRPSFEKRRNKFAWYGTRQRFHPVSLIFKETPHGVFIAHSYQYSPELSTFLVEVDPDTWKKAGLDAASEEESRRHCAQVFGTELGSNTLLTNRSLWFEANIVKNEKWTHGNIVLLGDALRTVHFSLGSGTRMAMQDAIALHQGLAAHPSDLAAAFEAFETTRRPVSSSFQTAAAKSLDWYETVADKLHLDPLHFAYDYMRRTGQVSHEDLRQRDPYFTAACESAGRTLTTAHPSQPPRWRHDMNQLNSYRFLCTAALLLACAAAPAVAQNFPAKPVRAVLPYSAGSGPDSVMRSVGEKLSRDWGQQLIIDNKPGANGWLAIGETKRAAPDGYTLMTVDATHMTLQPHLYKQLPFDPVKDFEPVAPLYSTNFFIVVGANSPYKNVTELLAAARVKEGNLTYGSWGIGSVAHVGTAMFENATKVEMRHIPFKELPQLYTAVATGEVDWDFGTAATVGPLYRAKKVRLLAYAGSRRMASYLDVPTVAESGGPAGFELQTWVAMYGPKGIPKPVAERIRGSVAKALAEADTRDRLANFGFEPWLVPSAEVTKAAEADKLRYAEIVKRAKIALD